MMSISLAFRNLFRNLRRTIAILLTVGLGAGALFSFQGFINGVLTDYKETTIHSHHGNGQVNTKGYRKTVYEEPSKYWVENYADLEYFLSQKEEVEHVFPRVSIGGMLVHNKISITGQGQGIIAKREAEFFDGLNIDEGEALVAQSNGILLGRGLANALDAHPGDLIKFYTKDVKGKTRQATFEVTGVFYTGSVDFDGRVFRIPLDKAQELLRTDKVESVSIGLSDHEYWQSVAASVEQAYPQLEATSFAELNKVYYQHSVDWLKAQFHVVQIIILSIVLLGIFNTISASVLERKQEIGNLRANGESKWDVMKQIVSEGIFLGVIGSILGLGLTYIIAKGFLHNGILMPPGPGSTKQFFIKFQFNGMMIVSTVVLSIISVVVASILSGMKVVRMPIAKALRAY